MKSRLNATQKLARFIGIKDGYNSWFLNKNRMADIRNPDNQNVKLSPNTSIALGTVTTKHLPPIIRERCEKDISAWFPNTFSSPLDD